jgi:addiction module HigA family antidote
VIAAAIMQASEVCFGFRSSGVFMTRSTHDSSGSRRIRTGGTRPAPITPGRFLRERVLAPDRITQEDLAHAMGVSRLTVNEIANDKRTVTAEMALRLEAVTRVSATMWLNLQRSVDLHRANASLADVLPRLRPITKKREFGEAAKEPELEPW